MLAPWQWKVIALYTAVVTVIHTVLAIHTQGDEAELAKKVAALRWHGKEIEVSPLLLYN